ncbi:MAG: hypothetical protein J3R72DRAFT_485812 [Linnemannia gamsii]|nr:MAG: hypothetical protein J3R72DRAFT_485812 [Linnemannia gamsii]
MNTDSSSRIFFYVYRAVFAAGAIAAMLYMGGCFRFCASKKSRSAPPTTTTPNQESTIASGPPSTIVDMDYDSDLLQRGIP